VRRPDARLVNALSAARGHSVGGVSPGHKVVQLCIAAVRRRNTAVGGGAAPGRIQDCNQRPSAPLQRPRGTPSPRRFHQRCDRPSECASTGTCRHVALRRRFSSRRRGRRPCSDAVGRTGQTIRVGAHRTRVLPCTPTERTSQPMSSPSD
jgi:hypothetical protein